MKSIFELRIQDKTFSLNKAVKEMAPRFSRVIQDSLSNLAVHLDINNLDHVVKGLIRFSFLIELVKDDVTSTKYELRWSPRLAEDPRFSTFDECSVIFVHLLSELSRTVSAEKVAIINTFRTTSILPFELPVDYITSTELRIHTASNINWFWGPEFNNTIALRTFIANPTLNPEYDVFKTMLVDKVRVKTYLTDRALTGVNKTNREKRWETHPQSVQFALKRDCYEVEKVLVLQICKFIGAPVDLAKNLIESGLLVEGFDHSRCPITGDLLIYEEFKAEILNTTHGRSKFQVGHLNPLKASNDDPNFGHSARNISWISENGNRIQGSLTLVETNELLSRIKVNRPEL